MDGWKNLKPGIIYLIAQFVVNQQVSIQSQQMIGWVVVFLQLLPYFTNN